MSEDRVQLVLCVSTGTFANTCDLAFTGKDLRISPIKYLAPILYDADKSVQYFLILTTEYHISTHISNILAIHLPLIEDGRILAKKR